MRLFVAIVCLCSSLTANAHLRWEAMPGGRSAPLPNPNDAPPYLRLLSSAATGILFTNSLAQDRYTTNQILLNGSGVAAGDVDGDDWCDLYFCGLDGRNALYRNLGNWKFEDITQQAGVACEGLDSTGAMFADLDGDSDLDLVVNSVAGGTHIFTNDGKGRFKPHTILNLGRGGMSLAAADVEGDGDLDLYLCNYRPTTLRDQPGTKFRVRMVAGHPVVALVNGRSVDHPDLRGRFTLNQQGGISEHGEMDAFFRNDGKAAFVEYPLAQAFGHQLPPLFDWGLSVIFRDLNKDRAPDLYVCNDFDSIDRIWINSGQGTFHPLPPAALRNTSKFSMGVDVADINRDGWDDLFVLDMLSLDHVTRLTRADKSMEPSPPGVIENRPQLGRNTLHLNRGDGTYAEIACFANLDASEWSWAPVFVDVDLDGFEDLLITTGHGRDDMDLDTGLHLEIARRERSLSVAEHLNMRRSSPSLPQRNLAFRNGGDLRFTEISHQWGFNELGISHGICLADLDNDGDPDLAVNNLNHRAAVYRNECGAARITVRLKGAGENTRGIGARITVSGGSLPPQAQEILAGGRYLSSDQPQRAFAAEKDQPMRVEVNWRDGKTSILAQVEPNRIYEVHETEATEAPSPTSRPPALPEPLFQDQSHLLPHIHADQPFDDFSRQLLLPNRLSQLGPGVSWIDLNNDGHDELIVSSGSGGTLSVFERTNGEAFKLWTVPPYNVPVARDQTTVLGFPSSEGVTQLMVGSANYETLGQSSLLLYQDGARTPAAMNLPLESSIGSLALADLDADRTLELFVGGRVIPGRYPVPASSAILKSHGTNWVRNELNSKPLEKVGLVSGAVWSDLDGDGFPELILACEWGPIKVFANEKGQLREATGDWGLVDYRGWWNGVTAGDFDGDGRMDLAASNWGLNTKYRASPERPRRLYFGALAAPSGMEMLEASFDPGLEKWVPERDLNSVGKALPWVREKFQLHRAYAQADIEEILGEHLQKTQLLEANWLETTVFLNRGDRFEARSLPPAAQFSPAFGINVADFDGDGAEDLFLSQNFFAVQPQTSRNDAGRGLLLKGKGDGTFTELVHSGIKVYGEQRGSAVADYDSDGRPDLAVSQNAAATKLYRNLAAKPGLTVRLQGSKGNPHAVGAKLRLDYGQGWGPAREVHAGSGYWSQNSFAQILASPAPPRRIQVQWPGGKFTTAQVPQDSRAIFIHEDGTVHPVP